VAQRRQKASQKWRARSPQQTVASLRRSLARERDQRREAIEQQQATAEILKAISESPTDILPVFQAIAERAARLCEAGDAQVFLVNGAKLDLVAHSGDVTLAAPSQSIDRGWATGRAVIERSPVQIADVLAMPVEFSTAQITAKPQGVRTVLALPLMLKGAALGTITLRRREVRPFSDKQIALLKTFTDQAVIAIENVRLFNETKEALERQTATAEILKVISGSPTDEKPVLDAIVTSAARLFGRRARIRLVEDGRLVMGARSDRPAIVGALDEPLPLDRDSAGGRVALDRVALQIADTKAPEAPPSAQKWGEMGRYRAIALAPLMRESTVLGVVSVTSPEPGALSEKQMALLQTFTDQAVIAIENARLFNQTKEALEQQTATAEILRVISSSPNDIQPVFDSIVAHAMRLCDAGLGTVGLYNGKSYQHVAQRGGSPEYTEWLFKESFQPGPGSTLALMIAEQRPVHIADYRELASYREGNPRSVATVELGRARTYLAVPMLKEGQVIGGITIRRAEVRPFTQKQIDLVSTFASQAVIAIENVRLFNETKEALERQTATSEILRVIAGTPTDTQPVFEAIVQSAQRLMSAKSAVLLLRRETDLYLAAYSMPGLDILPAEVRTAPLDRAKNFPSQVMLDRKIMHIPDWEADDVIEFERFVAKAYGIRSGLQVPLVRKGEGIGALAVTRETKGPFSEKEIALLQSFADQAVIAMENVRLFKELQERTEALAKSVDQLTALSQVGQAITSTLDLQAVLKTIVAHAVQLTGLDGGAIYEYDQHSEEYHLRASENYSEELVEAMRRTPIRRGEGPVWHAGMTAQPTEIPEMLDETYQTPRRDYVIREGFRALLVVPLVREDHIIGALAVSRKAPGPFAPEVIKLLKTFATQSALAIQNARLFREIEEKGKQLEVASRHKSDFLASMSHELRTPLNAILGFNEMILGQVYGDVPVDMQEPLKDIQTSGKHLLRLINNVLDLAKIEAGRMELALADYSVQDLVASVQATLRPLAAENELDLVAHVMDDVPLAHGDGGRLAQCLMNLVGNSLKFTKSGKVEILVGEGDGWLRFSVTDTGIGIAPEKIENLFTEFKQADATIASEYGGTGLGLSITKKFIEMHGGRIWVESTLGKGSAFKFEIPLRVSP
jgi:GAF domain-containing protein